MDDLAFLAGDAVLLGQAAKIFGIKRSVEMEGVSDMTNRRVRHLRPGVHELVGERGRGVDRIFGKVLRPAALVGAEPVLVAA